MNRPTHVRGRRGQSLAELCIVMPILVLLFFGVYSAAALISDKSTIAQATRTGARVGSAIAAAGYGTSSAQVFACQAGDPKDPCGVDNQILAAIRPELTNRLSNVALLSVTIYQPTACPSPPNCASNDGAINGCPPPNCQSESFSTTTWTRTGTYGYGLDERVQIHPDEASIGVSIKYTYTSPGLKYFTTTQTEFTVMRLAPVFTS